jgi:hypothetical protein
MNPSCGAMRILRGMAYRGCHFSTHLKMTCKMLKVFVPPLIITAALILTGCSEERPGKVIFESKGGLVDPYKIKVNELRVITETDDRLVVDLIYTYEHEIPPEQVKIFIMPNHGYWSTNDIRASKGKNVGRASIGLSRSNMEKDNVTTSYTDVLRIRFEHYAPDKYMGNIWSEDVVYEKNWELKNR